MDNYVNFLENFMATFATKGTSEASTKEGTEETGASLPLIPCKSTVTRAASHHAIAAVTKHWVLRATSVVLLQHTSQRPAITGTQESDLRPDNKDRTHLTATLCHYGSGLGHIHAQDSLPELLGFLPERGRMSQSKR